MKQLKDKGGKVIMHEAIKIDKKLLKGGHDLIVDIANTVPYKYFFKKEKGKVYRYSKIADEDWRKDEMPFTKIPFVHL